MNIFRNYASIIRLMTGILTGGALGVIFGEDAHIVKPVGDAFLNLMFVLIVPLVFFSISSAIYNMKQSDMVGEVLVNAILVFFFMALTAAFAAYLLTIFYNPLDGIDKAELSKNLPKIDSPHSLSAGELFVRTFTVPDFLQLFSKSNLLPLIVFSILVGLATASIGEKGDRVAKLLNPGTAVVMRMMNIIMRVAPIGLGCYFAATIGHIGGQILNGYLNAFLLYMALAMLYYFAFNSIFVWVAGGKTGLKTFWRNIITPSLTAIATSSSAACIPVNIEAAHKMGVPAEIAETVIPLGTNMHKDGSVMGGIIKIVFLLTIFGHEAGISWGTCFSSSVSPCWLER